MSEPPSKGKVPSVETQRRWVRRDLFVRCRMVATDHGLTADDARRAYEAAMKALGLPEDIVR
jgi:hypothetical protein